MAPKSGCFRLILALTTLSRGPLVGPLVVHADETFDQYDYGDLNYSYDDLLAFKRRETSLGGGDAKDMNGAPLGAPLSLPLCCPEGEVYNGAKCIFPPADFDWTPRLDGALGTPFYVSGFPKCKLKVNHIETYQKEVHFNKENGKAFLPYHVQLEAVSKENYCVAKIYDPVEQLCEEFQTKIFTCLNEEREPEGLMWGSVVVAHTLLLVTLINYFCFSDLRCLQGQYMICFLISLFIYNLCLFPGSQLPLNISDVSCIALGAVKYFFFCSVFLWFNTICFDIWRTIRNRQDISGRRRFLLYSAYSWVVGAILTTIVLVLPYMKDGMKLKSRDDPLRDKNYDSCKLRREMNMILQIAQFISILLNFILMISATCALYGYTKFGNGLPRCDASLCLKQGWKLFIIMVAHMLSCIGQDIMKVPIKLWLYVLLESVAIFGVLAYRRTLLKRIFKDCCRTKCFPSIESGNPQEKGQLTLT